MKLRYETGTATLIHFLVIMLLGFIGGVEGVYQQCHGSGVADCVQGSMVTLVYVLLLAGWFGFLAILGYAAQDQRNHKLARALMIFEFPVVVVALFQAKHFPSILGLVTSLIDATFAIWIIYLAFRLSRAKGGRITKVASRPRRRPVKQS